MEVVKKRVALLTNQEVFEYLNSLKKVEDSKSKNEKCKSLSTIMYETKKYLEKSPAATQTSQSICELVPKLSKFHLTPAEVLQIINLKPTLPTDIQLLVEETEERFPNEEELQELVDIVNESLPPPPKRH